MENRVKRGITVLQCDQLSSKLDEKQKSFITSVFLAVSDFFCIRPYDNTAEKCCHDYKLKVMQELLLQIFNPENRLIVLYLGIL